MKRFSDTSTGTGGKIRRQPPQATRRIAASPRELRFFGGFSEQEATSILDISVATLKRDWEFARDWLLARLQ